MKKRFFVPMALMVVLTMLLASLPAAADPPPPGADASADTVAVIQPTGAPPTIVDKWEVSGNNSIIALANGAYPADPVFTPSPLSDPIPANDGQQPICVWAVITDTMGINNISGAYFKIFEPKAPATGLSFKLQVPMTRVTDPGTIEAGKLEGIRSGQMTQAMANQYDEWILKQWATAWYACFPYTIHQQPGQWQAEVFATNAQGSTAKLANFFNINSLVSIATDFSAVNYGPILPGLHKSIPGNGTFSNGDGLPTVWNKGNFPAQLKIYSTPMIGVVDGKEITDFDVMLSSLDPTQQWYTAGTWHTILGWLLPCNPTQIDFSIKAPLWAGQDTYNGKMYLDILPYPTGFGT